MFVTNKEGPVFMPPDLATRYYFRFVAVYLATPLATHNISLLSCLIKLDMDYPNIITGAGGRTSCC